MKTREQPGMGSFGDGETGSFGDGEQGSKGAREQGREGAIFPPAKALTPIPTPAGGRGGNRSCPHPHPHTGGGERGESLLPSPPTPHRRGGEGGIAPHPPITLLPSIVMLLVCLLLTSCQLETPPQGVKVKVERVLSGQTLEITNTTGPQKLRLLGIDAPDGRQEPHGPAAKEKLRQMVEGKWVLLEYDLETQDSYGRQLGYIWLDGQLVQEVLVRDGYVLVRSQNYKSAQLSPNTKHERRLNYAQKWARQQELGIWNPQNPLRLTPAQFRRRQEERSNS